MTVAAVVVPPRAYPPTGISGHYRVFPEDFVVCETLAFEPAGHGEHLYLRVEKRLQNTRTVADALAAAYGLAPVDVGYAGQKDRRAVTRQWFSVTTVRDDATPALPQGCRVIAADRHPRKLRRGEIRSNRFEVRVRELRGDPAVFLDRVGTIAARGFPNYFGPQRFGNDGANVARALAYLGTRPRPRLAAWQHGLHLSVGRSVVFNTVLAHRVANRSWDTPLDGEVADAGAPTGPLWGRGRSPVQGCAAAVENEALAGCAQWLGPLEHVGLQQERRALVARAEGLAATCEKDAVQLTFELGPGRYASVLLREIGDIEVASGSVA